MSANRAFFCVTLTAYIQFSHIGPQGLGAWLLGAGLTMTAMIFAHILMYPAPNMVRRTVALIADFSTLLSVMHFSDEEGAAFYPLILWTILGNGFRFGLTALRLAVVVGSLGFTLVVITTPFWMEHINLAIGLGLGLLVLPAYTGVLIKSLTKARQRAEAANEVKTAFLANVSHELRTPLQALLGTTDLLKATGLNAEQSELVRITCTAGETLLLMINDFLQFTGLNTADFDLRLDPTDPVKILQDVAGLVTSDCRKKGLRLALHAGPNTPAIVNADARHIREVLLNLVGNAVKFTETGGILIVVENAQSINGPLLRFSVTDTGIGVPDEAKQKVFDRFTQADDTIAQRFGGTGLGLAICKRRVELMGGRIGIDDGEGRGSVFWFELPVGHVSIEHDIPAFARAPVVLLLKDGMARGRLAKIASDQGRHKTHFTIDTLTRLADSINKVDTSSIVVLQTSLASEFYSEFGAGFFHKNFIARRPLILINDADFEPTSVTWDPRWIAITVLPARFTDEQVIRAFEIADHFAEVAIESDASSSPILSLRSKILIVDDNKTNQLIYSKLLGSTGCHCQVAENGEEALNALDNDGFDLVLMDVNMPIIDGIRATQLQRVAELGMSRVPIVGITADASPEMKEKCLAAGMDACLIKPVSSPVLLELVAEFLKKTSVHLDHSPPADTAVRQDQAVVSEIDWQPLDSLVNVGGKDFVREVLGEFVRDCRDLLGDLRVANALGKTEQVRAAAHAIASTSANVGAVRVRTLALEFERLAQDRMEREGAVRVDQLRQAVRRYLTALGDMVGGGGRQLDCE